MSRRPSLLLAHGWGFDRSLWDPIRALLPDCDTACIEHGYLGAPAFRPPVPAGTVLVGHSAGVLDLLSRPPPGCTTLVAINGFTRFTAAPDWPNGIPGRLLDRMLVRLADDPASMTAAFRHRCGLAASAPTRPCPATLRSGLLALRDGDMRNTPNPAILALAGASDPIVPPALTRACFAEQSLIWAAEAGHLLPLTHPDWCVTALRQLLAS